MEGHLAALRVTDLWQNEDAEVPQEVAPNALEEKDIVGEFDMPEEHHILAPSAVYIALEHVQNIIEATLKVHEETTLQRLISDTVDKKVLNLFKEAFNKALTGTFTKFCQTVQQFAVKAVYFGGEDNVRNIKVGKLAELQDFR